MSSADSPAPWPDGYRINPRHAGPAQDLIDAFRGVPVAVAGDCLGRAIGTIGLTAYHGDLRTGLCGPAITVRVRPGDNLMIHKAMLMAEPGDVIVVDGGGIVSQAVAGGLMRTTAIARKLGGFVIDGAIRDIAEWAEGGMPVFAKGHTHRGPSKDGPGEVNVPIACAGLAVNPGDLVLGDADGVIAIAAADAGALLPKVHAQLVHEATMRESNAKGVADHERFNALLRSKGIPI
jgi:regulator of RNase E activity RraA